MLTAYTVRCYAKRSVSQDDIDIYFDEICVSDSPQRAMEMVKHYRTTHPAPKSFSCQVIKEEPYVHGETQRDPSSPLPPRLRDRT